MNTLVSPLAFWNRFDAKTSFLPSGENIGKPSNDAFHVTRSSPVPSTLTSHSSKSRPRGLCWFDEKMIFLPSGEKNGAKLAPPSEVTWPQAAAVGVHHEDLERGRPPEPVAKQRPVVVELWTRRERAAAEDDLRAVGREERPAVGPDTVGQPLHVAAVGVHRVDLHVAVAHAGEDDPAVGPIVASAS